MDIIEQARLLGAAIQNSEIYKTYDEAARAGDTCAELQKKIGEFNILRADLNREMSKTDKDAERMTRLDNDIRELYADIMNTPEMTALNAAKDDLNHLLGCVQNIISCAANGEDPMTCSAEPHSCSGSCSSCGGCC